MHDLDVRQVVPVVARTVRGTRRLERVERHPYRAIADRVHVHLEALCVERRRRLAELVLVEERDAAVAGRVPVSVEVRLEHRGGEVLADAVRHDLHARRGEPAYARALATLQQERQLVEAAPAFEPQGADHARGERAALGGRHVGIEAVLDRRVLADDRVLPRGDAQCVQVTLPDQQPLNLLLERRARDQPADEVHRPFVERPAGGAVGVALDAAVGGVGRAGVHARELERPRVDPGAVVVAVVDEHRAVGDELVQDVLGRGAAGEHVHRPPAPEDPLGARVRPRVRRDQGSVLLQAVRLGQVDPQPVEPRGRRVHVRILEAREQEPAGQVDDLRRRADELADIRVGPHRDDATVADGDGLYPAPERVDGVDAAVREGEIGGRVGSIRQRAPPPCRRPRSAPAASRTRTGRRRPPRGRRASPARSCRGGRRAPAARRRSRSRRPAPAVA